MRRYRYGDPTSSKGRSRVIGQVLKFFIGWNVLGYCVWTYLKSSGSKLDPEFERKGTSEKILSMMGFRDVEQSKYRLKIGGEGFKLGKDEDASAGKSDENIETTNPDITAGSPQESTNDCSAER